MASTKWKPGQSGNPKGRPTGFTWAASVRKSVADTLPEAVQALVAAVRQGDVAAARTLLEFGLPRPKPIETAEPKPLLESASLAEQGVAILDGVRTGQVSVADGSQLLTAIGAHARAIEVIELERRIAALEGAK